MSRKTKIWFIAAAIVIALGLCVFTLALACSGWDITKLGTTKFETNEHEITKEFTNISIDTDTSDIILLPSTDGKCKVVCNEAKNLNHSVSVIDGTLKIKLIDTRKWYEYINLFSFGKRKITVYLPKAEYEALNIKTDTGDTEISKEFRLSSVDVSGSTGDVKCYASVLETLKIEMSTGDVRVENISVGALDVTTDTGDITVSSVTCTGGVNIEVDTGKTVLENVSCKILTSDGNTGDISLTSVIASEKIWIERDTGDVRLDRIDALEMEITTDTGDVKGTVRSDKHFIAKSDTGRVRVPETGGNIFRITTDTGDIIISIATE